MDKILSWFRDSLTILWARVSMAFGIIGVLLTEFAGVLTAVPALQALAPPRWAGFLLAVTGVITELARRRTLPKKE